MEARRVGRYQQDRQALVLREVGIGAHREPHVVGLLDRAREELLAIDDVLVAIASSARLQRGEVGACARLGISDREVQLAPEDAREHGALLLIGTERHERRSDTVQREQRQRHAGPVRLLDEDHLVDRTAGLAAVLHRPADPEPTVVAHPTDVSRVARLVARVGLDLLDQRREVRAQLGFERFLLGCERELHLDEFYYCRRGVPCVDARGPTSFVPNSCGVDARGTGRRDPTLAVADRSSASPAHGAGAVVAPPSVPPVARPRVPPVPARDAVRATTARPHRGISSPTSHGVAPSGAGSGSAQPIAPDSLRCAPSPPVHSRSPSAGRWIRRSLELGRALMLNASFEPLCVVSVRRAVVLVLKEKAEIVERNGAEFRSERTTLPAPSVIRLVHFVRVPFRTRVPLSRRRVRSRRPAVPVLLPRRREHRSRRAPLPRRHPLVGQRRRLLPRLQRARKTASSTRPA